MKPKPNASLPETVAGLEAYIAEANREINALLNLKREVGTSGILEKKLRKLEAMQKEAVKVLEAKRGST